MPKIKLYRYYYPMRKIMSIREIYILAVLIFLIPAWQACSSGRNSSAQEQKTAPPPQVLKPASANLAPGAARIIAIPVAINKQESKYFYVLKVEQILGYGMSTPVLTVGSEIQAEMGIIQDQQIEQFNSAVKKQSGITVTMQSLPVRTGEVRTPVWRIIEFDKTTTKKLNEE
jgi:hypothetical protein